MKIALAQINPIIGDFEYNFNKIIDNIKLAKQKQANIIIFPELAICGYPPLDFLNRIDFIETALNYIEKIKEYSNDITIFLGAVTKNNDGGKPLYNSCVVIQDGKIINKYHKRLLPTYDVFDEARYFEPGKDPSYVEIGGKKIGITICEDIWTEYPYNPYDYKERPVEDLARLGVDLIVNLSASPYYLGKIQHTQTLLSIHSKKHKIPIAYINQVGANDEIIFQGHSMVFDKNGNSIINCKDFEEDLVIWDTEKEYQVTKSELNEEDELIAALCLGLFDYVKKLNFKNVVLGLSGGIDSSVVASIATIALGAENVTGIAMPGPYNSPESLEDAKLLAKNLGINFFVVPINSLFSETKSTLKEVFKGTKEDVTEENIQSRLRGIILMAISNKFGSLLLNTGNKSELAVGYCTLYGDTNGALSILGDVKKTYVYKIAKKINERFAYIPERVLIKPPSAELRPNQKDEDTLPPYDFLDKVIERYIELGKSYEEIVEDLGNRELVKEIINTIKKNEYKRRQTPPVLKVTQRAFGIGWRFPIVHRYKV